MAENDLANDLESLANDLGGGLGDAAAGEGGLDLDADLQAMADEAAPAEGAPAAAGGGDAAGFDADLQAMAADTSADQGGGGAAMAPMAAGEGGTNLDFLFDIKLSVTFEVGRAKMLISDLLTLGQGSVIELHRLVGDELDLLINGKLVAKGEVVVVNEKFGCKITSIVSPEDRIRYMGGF
jgi:flagellar motor switch protein FliN/FliY